MRLSREAKAEHHEEIKTSASQMFRERGIEGTSLADLMQSVGLTHGGFYRHFKSKDELVAISAAKAFEEVRERFKQRASEAGPKVALKEYVLGYLSADHRDDPATGCVVAAVGAEAARQASALRDVFTQGILGMAELIQSGLSGSSKTRSDRAVELGALMIGSVIMARATNDEKLSSDILATVRRRALQIIEGD